VHQQLDMQSVLRLHIQASLLLLHVHLWMVDAAMIRSAIITRCAATSASVAASQVSSSCSSDATLYAGKLVMPPCVRVTKIGKMSLVRYMQTHLLAVRFADAIEARTYLRFLYKQISDFLTTHLTALKDDCAILVVAVDDLDPLVDPSEAAHKGVLRAASSASCCVKHVATPGFTVP
jgi:hypothetical protein